MKERPILFSKITGKRSLAGQRLKSEDGLTWKQRNREAVNARRRQLYAANPELAERNRKRSSEYRKKNPLKVFASNAAWRRKFFGALRAELLAAYGGRCACCGEVESIFLDLDHIDNDGASDRKKHSNGQQLMVWLKATGWPRYGYQILCCNCNQGKARNGGVCPHQTRKSHAA